MGKEFRKTQIFVCSSSAGLKSGKRNRPPLRKKEPHAALRPPYPPKGIKIVKLRRRARSLGNRRESDGAKGERARAPAAGAASTRAQSPPSNATDLHQEVPGCASFVNCAGQSGNASKKSGFVFLEFLFFSLSSFVFSNSSPAFNAPFSQFFNISTTSRSVR